MHSRKFEDLAFGTVTNQQLSQIKSCIVGIVSIDDVIWHEVIVEDHVLGFGLVVALVYPRLIPLERDLELLEL